MLLRNRQKREKETFFNNLIIMYQCTILCYSKNKGLSFWFILVGPVVKCGGVSTALCLQILIWLTQAFFLKAGGKNTAVCGIGDEWVGVNTWKSPHICKVSDGMTHCNVIKKPNSRSVV